MMQHPKRSTTTGRRREDGAPSRWDQYVDLLGRRRVPEKARRWYVARVEGFLKDLQPGSLGELTGDEITGYFQMVSSQGKLADWQFRQFVDAIQLLVVDLARLPVGGEIDWDYWKEAGRPLDAAHPTIARELEPDGTGGKGADGPRKRGRKRGQAQLAADPMEKRSYGFTSDARQ